MPLPLRPPILPMLSKRVDALPEGPGWLFEPKWDGFRAVVFREGERVELQSRDAKPLARYFPELLEPLRAALPPEVILDGEIVLATPAGLDSSRARVPRTALDFEALQMRLHPAASRVKLLSERSPVSLVLWDVLALGERSLLDVPFAERRRELEGLLADARPPLHLTPVTDDRALAADWFERFEGAGLDGVMAKRADGRYEPDKRVMLKVKHERTADCVVAGFRWHKNGEGTHVGSLLLGLWGEDGALHHVGVTASFTEKARRELVATLAPHRAAGLEGHPWARWAEWEAQARKPGMKSRWSTDKTLAWEPLRPELVVEVAYDHMQGTRFRHTARFRRWRSDKPPAACTFEQLDVTPPYELERIFSGGG